MKNLIRNRYAKLTAFVLLTYTLIGFLLVPFLIQHYLPKIMEKSLGAHASLYKASFNPYTFQLKLDRLVVQDKDALRLASFDNLKIDFDVNDLLAGQLLFKEIYLQHLKLDIRVDDCGIYNFQHILNHLAGNSTVQDENSTSTEMLGVRIQHLLVDDARILFEDRSLQEPFTVKTKPFDIELRDFSTVLNEEGKLRFMIATHETGSIQSTASISLQPFSINGNFEVDDFNINKLYSYIKDNVDFKLEGNRVNAAFDYNLAYKDAALTFDMLKTSINVDRLQYSDANQSVGFITLNSTVDAIHLRKTEAKFETQLKDFAIDVADLNYSNRQMLQTGLVTLKSSLASVDLYQSSHDPLGLTLNDYALKIDGARYSDNQQRKAVLNTLETGFERTALVFDDMLKVDVDKVRLRLNDTGFEDPAMRARLAAFDHTLAHLVLTQTDGALAMHFTGAKNVLDDLYYSDSRNVATLNSVDLELSTLDIDKLFNAAGVLKSVDVTGIHLANRKRELLNMKSIVVKDTILDTAANEYNVTKVSLNRPMMNLRLYEELKTDLDYLSAAPKPTRTPASTPQNEAVRPAAQLNINDIWLNNARFTFKDLRKEPVVLTFRHINTHVKNATLNERSTIYYSFSHKMPGEGDVKGSGYVRAKPLSAKLDLQTSRVDLRPYTPYVQEFVNMDINSSYLTTKLAFRVKQQKELNVTVQGDLSLQEIDLAHATKKERLLSVKEVRVNTIDFKNKHLKINDILIDTPYNKIAIDENKSTNFDGLLVAEASINDENSTQNESNASAKEPVTFMLGELSIVNGTMDFSDFSLPLKFKTRVDNLEGKVVAVSSSLEETTTVRLDGVVDEYGSAKIGGSLIAADPTKATDITVDFKNIDVTSLSPYSGKFIGRKIQSGKLWLDLGYKIDNKELLSSNKIKIKDLELGEEIESEDAVNLPVSLAIALLKDSDGYIDVSVPVEGNVDDPDFKYGAAAFKAIGNLIVGIAAAPFKFLGSALGIDAEAMAKIEFDFGSAVLNPPEKEKLDKLVEVFVQRPEIGLVLTSSYMLSRDKAGVQKKKLYALAVGKFKESDERSSKYSFVRKLYIQTFGDEKYDLEYDALKDSLKEGEDFDSLFFDIQWQALIEAQTVTQKELETLAMERSVAIRDHLLSKGFDAKRITIADKTEVLEESDAAYMTMVLGVDVKTKQ